MSKLKLVAQLAIVLVLGVCWQMIVTGKHPSSLTHLMLFAYECRRIPERIDKESLTTLMNRNVNSETLPWIELYKAKNASIHQIGLVIRKI